MDAKKFLLERRRMCGASYDHDLRCSKCEACREDGYCAVFYEDDEEAISDEWMLKATDAAIAVVEKWSKEHPLSPT